jgi:hypothetical protein
MANILNESISVSAADGLVRIAHTQLHDSGIDLGGVLVCDRSALGWLADEVAKAAEVWGYVEVDEIKAPDHFTVYVGGSDMQPFVHVHNQRDPSSPEGRTYTLGMTVDAARSLVDKLRAL